MLLENSLYDKIVKASGLSLLKAMLERDLPVCEVFMYLKIFVCYDKFFRYKLMNFILIFVIHNYLQRSLGHVSKHSKFIANNVSLDGEKIVIMTCYWLCMNIFYDMLRNNAVGEKQESIYGPSFLKYEIKTVLI